MEGHRGDAHVWGEKSSFAHLAARPRSAWLCAYQHQHSPFMDAERQHASCFVLQQCLAASVVGHLGCDCGRHLPRLCRCNRRRLVATPALPEAMRLPD
jgi:hypothetical protein